jgi:ketosteroid isomerase-like protein
VNLIIILALSRLFIQPGTQPPPSNRDTPPTIHTVSADSAAILTQSFTELAQNWMRAYNRCDSAALAAMYTPDSRYISGHVRGLVAEGRDRVIANFLNGVRMGGHIDSVSVLSVQSSCNLTAVLCRYEATNSGEKAAGRTLLVVRKIGASWLITLHMTVV